MKKAFVILLLFAAAMGNASAGGYADFNAGILARSDRNAAETIRFMSEALSAPDLPAHLRPTAFYARAQAYTQNKQYEQALADYTSTLALQAANYDALIERGSIYEEESKYDLARTDFLAAIRLRPELDQAYRARAEIDITEKKFGDAIKDYDEALTTSPDDIDLILLRGGAYRLAERFGEAIADFNTAIHMNSRYGTAYQLRAAAYLESGNLRAAISDYDDAVDIEPDDLYLRERAGIAHWDYGDYRSAARDLERSASVHDDPKRVLYSELWLRLTMIRLGRDDGDFAGRVAKLDLKPWPGLLLSLYAGTTTADEVFAKAKQGTAGAQRNQICEANFFVAEWNLAKKDNTSARSLLEQATSSCPRGLPELYAARTELKGLAQ